MAAIDEWGAGAEGLEMLSEDDLNLKLKFCEELTESIEITEGSKSRSKGFIALAFLRTLDFMKGRNMVIAQVRYVKTKNSHHIFHFTKSSTFVILYFSFQEKMKRIQTLKKEIADIFKYDTAAPTDLNFSNI